MDDRILEIGVGAVVALMIIKEVLPHLRRNGRHVEGKTCEYSQVCKLRHDALKMLINSVNDNISAQTCLLRDICKEIRDVKELLPRR